MWTVIEQKHIAEISTLECNNAMVCPECKYPITLPQPIREKDGEVIKWDFKCRRCRAWMIIFND